MKALKITYLTLSGLAFIILLCVGIACIYSAMTAMSGGNEQLSPEDLIFLLNHGDIVTEQDYKIIYSYQSGSSFNGDHLDYYCIQLEKFAFQSDRENAWVYGPEDNEIFKKARALVASEGKAFECFPENVQIDSEEVAAKIWSLDIRRDDIEGALVILFHKPSKRLLYVSSQR